MNAAARLWKDLQVALLAFALVFSFGFVFGRLLIPGFELTLPEVVPEEATALPDPVLLRAELAGVPEPAAIFSSLGGMETHVVLDRVEALDRSGFPGEDEPGEGVPVDLNVRFSGSDGIVLTVVADQMEEGERRNEGLTVVVASRGQNYNARAGMCVLEIHETGYFTHPTPWGHWTRPTYKGSVACEGVPELRSDATLDFVAVFAYDGS